jgi:hypothetical protein
MISGDDLEVDDEEDVVEENGNEDWRSSSTFSLTFSFDMLSIVVVRLVILFMNSFVKA